MRFLLLLLLAGFAACNGHTPGAVASATHDTAHAIADTNKTKVQPPPPAGASANPLYTQRITAHAFTLLQQLLPDWHLIDPKDWNDYWFKQCLTDSSLVNYISADFNCDGKKDYAFVLANRNHESAVWILQSQGESYQAISLRELGKLATPIDMGIILITPGELNESIDDDGEPSTQCPAIEVQFFEQAAVTYYWNKDKYEAMQTGD